MVEYKGVWLARNSKAYELWANKDFKELDKHIKEVDRREKELLARYSTKDN